MVYGIDITPFATPSAAAEALHNLWASTYLPIQSVECNLDETLVKFGPNTTGPSAIYADQQAGDVTGDNASPAAAFLIRKVTAAGGRTNRGRMYIPGVSEGTYGDRGILSGGTITSLGTAGEDFLSGLAFISSEMVILHTQPGTPTPVTSLEPSNVLATQRRRLRR